MQKFNFLHKGSREIFNCLDQIVFITKCLLLFSLYKRALCVVINTANGMAFLFVLITL
jgi:hypothetical protein